VVICAALSDRDTSPPASAPTLPRGLDAQTLGRVKREMQLARRVTHPNVCRLYDIGTHRVAGGEAIPFLTMELVDGETLAERLRRDGPLPIAKALDVAAQIAAALDAAHASGVVHRDLTSRNVMIARDRVVVTDFGIAVDGATQSAPLVGTAAYMAPEQVAGGDVGPRADVYALGVVSMEMVTGRLPFDGATPRELAARRLSEAPTDPLAVSPGLPGTWRTVILRCLARDAAARYASAGEAVAALRPSRRRRVLLGLTATLGVLVIGALVWAQLTSAARADRVTQLVTAAQAADYRAGETLAREALALDPTSRAARLALARALFDRSRVAPERRSVAFDEARTLATELVREQPNDIAARDLDVTGLYLAGDRFGALAELPMLPEHRRLQVAPRIAWTEGWLELAREGLARCLEAMPHDARCLHLNQFEVEIARGRAGLEAVLADPIERSYPPLSRVRMRILVGRIDEAALVAETGFANGTLDLLDAPYVNGLVAAARHGDETAAHQQELLTELLRNDDGPVALRLAGALQLAELAAIRGDEEGVVAAAQRGLELGFLNGDVWEHGLLFAPFQERLAPLVATMRARAAEELALARARGLVAP